MGIFWCILSSGTENYNVGAKDGNFLVSPTTQPPPSSDTGERRRKPFHEMQASLNQMNSCKGGTKLRGLIIFRSKFGFAPHPDTIELWKFVGVTFGKRRTTRGISPAAI